MNSLTGRQNPDCMFMPPIEDPEKDVPFASNIVGDNSTLNDMLHEFGLPSPQPDSNSSQSVSARPPSPPSRKNTSHVSERSSTQETERQKKCMKIFKCIFWWRTRSKVTPNYF